MRAVTDRYIEQLRPWLESGQPNDKGEIGLLCPLHDDQKRSASLNVVTGDWYCHVCEFGANVEYLLMVAEAQGAPRLNGKTRQNGKDEDLSEGLLPAISEGLVQGYASALGSNRSALKTLCDRRGLTVDTISHYEIGYSVDDRAYTIPVRNSEGACINIRFWDPSPSEDRRKIWGITGHNTPTLYPISVLADNSEVTICEGEWDALVLNQHGIPAVTRTGAAKVWKSMWNHHFDDKVIYLCHDMDKDGQAANRKVETHLKKHAREIRTIILPYEVTDKHGKDVSDFFLDGHTAVDFKELMLDAQGVVRDPDLVGDEFVDVGVLDSFAASRAGQKLRMRVTISGKNNPPYQLPKSVNFSCTQDAGAKCQICPMNEMGGVARRDVEPHDPRILQMLGASDKQVQDVLRGILGAQKCSQLVMEAVEERNVEELFVRPSVDRQVGFGDSGDYTARKILSVGRHDSLPNNTVEVVGSIHPNPKDHRGEFLAWDVTKLETSIDRFEVDRQVLRRLGVFRNRTGQRPLARLAQISRDLAANVTHIYGRGLMHALMDLTWHSVLGFYFDGELEKKGWLDTLILGDTRTGKSKVAEALIGHYRAGEYVSCESATFAGIVGGLQQLDSRSWEVTWGAVPINDRRLVVLDEVSGLHPEQIAQMSSIRSSGEAQLTKIRSERTWARTRLLWMGNPRNGKLGDYTYGVQAIAPLIGNAEDVARFDLAMSVAAGEVDPGDINRSHTENVAHTFTSDLCHELLVWCWSRTPEQVEWESCAVQAVYDSALELGDRYVDDPPLIQPQNVRVKIARVAVALAARTFSTDPTGEVVLVKKEHVEDTVKFIDKLYGASGFGYGALSEAAKKDLAIASDAYFDCKQWLVGVEGLAGFLKGMRKFRRQDLEDMLNMDRDQANMTINQLWNFRMVTRRGADVMINPLLHEVLREVKDV